MNKPTDEELNKWIHENVMGGGKHDVFVFREPHGMQTETVYACVKCATKRYESEWPDECFADMPDYCSDLNAVREVETKVIQERGTLRYDDALLEVAGEDVLNMGHAEWALLTAKSRAVACKLAWEAK